MGRGVQVDGVVPRQKLLQVEVVAAAQEQAALSPDGMLSPRLGLFLDEAGNCAALSDLDVLATTARSVRYWDDSQASVAAGTPAAARMVLTS